MRLCLCFSSRLLLCEHAPVSSKTKVRLYVELLSELLYMGLSLVLLRAYADLVYLQKNLCFAEEPPSLESNKLE